MTIDRRFGLRIAALALGASTIVAVLPLSVGASVTKPTTNSVIIATKAAISKQSGVHLLVTSKSGSTSTTVTADIGKSSGTETIDSGQDNVTIKVTPTYAYLGGNAAGLTAIIGLSSAEQKKVGSSWISMKAGTTPYKDLKSSVTITVLGSMLPVLKGTTFSKDNAKDYLLTWTTKATSSTPKTKSVFTISSAKVTLPLKETVTASTGTGTTTFSNWGERVSVNVPSLSSTIAYSKVVAA